MNERSARLALQSETSIDAGEPMSDDGNTPLVSIIVLNYDGRELLSECLKSLLQLTEYPRFEVLVVDNGSKDDSVEVASKIVSRWRRAKVIALEKNFGYAEGNNLGYCSASKQAKYIVFLNNDIVVTQGWLKRLVSVLEDREDIGAAQPLIIAQDKAGVDGASFLGGYLDVFGDDCSVRTPGPSFEPERVDTPSECFYALGAALVTRRDVISEIGLFNPRYFLNYEETDFCWRVRLSGRKVAVVLSSKVYHAASATIKKHVISLAVPYHTYKNRLYTLLVNYQCRNVIRYVPLTIISHTAGLICNMVSSVIERGAKREISKARASGGMKSLLYILTHFPAIWRDRLMVQTQIRRIADAELIGRFIIVPRPPLPRSIVEMARKLATLTRTR